MGWISRCTDNDIDDNVFYFIDSYRKHHGWIKAAARISTRCGRSWRANPLATWRFKGNSLKRLGWRRAGGQGGAEAGTLEQGLFQDLGRGCSRAPLSCSRARVLEQGAVPGFPGFREGLFQTFRLGRQVATSQNCHAHHRRRRRGLNHRKVSLDSRAHLCFLSGISSRCGSPQP